MASAPRFAGTRRADRVFHWGVTACGVSLLVLLGAVGFVLLIPLVFTIALRAGLSLVKIGIPLVAGLSVVHGMLPPHPAAMLAVGAFKADVGRTLLYGLIVGLPTAALAGPIYAAWIAPRIVLPAYNPLAAQLVGAADDSSALGDAVRTPGFAISVFTVLIPVVLMLLSSAADATQSLPASVRPGPPYRRQSPLPCRFFPG